MAEFHLLQFQGPVYSLSLSWFTGLCRDRKPTENCYEKCGSDCYF